MQQHRVGSQPSFPKSENPGAGRDQPTRRSTGRRCTCSSPGPSGGLDVHAGHSRVDRRAGGAPSLEGLSECSVSLRQRKRQWPFPKVRSSVPFLELAWRKNSTERGQRASPVTSRCTSRPRPLQAQLHTWSSFCGPGSNAARGPAGAL